MKPSRALTAALLLAFPALAAACSQGPNIPTGDQTYTASAQPGDVGATVTLEYSSFEPAIVTIKAGQSVEWQWLDYPSPHDVSILNYVGANGQTTSIQSPVMEKGNWYQVFPQPGTYDYVCTIHANMRGEVIVTGPNGTTGTTGSLANPTGSGYGTTGTGATGAGTGTTGAGTGATGTTGSAG